MHQNSNLQKQLYNNNLLPRNIYNIFRICFIINNLDGSNEVF